MEGSSHSTLKNVPLQQEEGSSYLPSSLWQWEGNDEDYQEDQPYDFSDDVAVNDWNEAEVASQLLEETDAVLQKNNHRLLLQGLISGLVVVLCGFLVMVYNIASSVGFIIFGGSSFVDVFQSFGNKVHFYLLAFRITFEVLIILGVVAVFAHRIVGFGLGVYLRTMLDPDRTGQYAFQFDWISLRCGLDQNMLVIAGFEWRNPPVFTNTPYFLRINEINFVIDSMSVYRALTDENESIHISQIKLDKATIYLEKLSQRSINRAAAAAAHKQPVYASPVKPLPVQESLDESAHKEVHTNLDDSDAMAAATPTKTKKIKKQLPVGMLNLWACMGATDVAQEASFLSTITKKITKAMAGTTNMVQLLGATVARIDVTGTFLKSAQNVGNSIGNTIGGSLMRTFGNKKAPSTAPARDRTRTMSTVDSGIAMSDEDSSHNNLHPEGDLNVSTHSGSGTLTYAETMALLQQEYPDLVLPPLPEEAFDEDDLQHNYDLLHPATPGASSNTTSTTTSAKVNSEAKNKKQSDKDKWKGFGIKYKLEIDQLYLHDVQLHAQDFLNAKHTKDRKAGVIKLKSVVMFRNELTLAPDKRIGKNRRGIYLDDVVWRLVNKLLSELLRHNSLAMMVLLSSAAANRTTSAVSSSASIASYSATTAKKAFTGLGSVFSSSNTSKSPVRGRSDTTTSVSSAAAPPSRERSDTGASKGVGQSNSSPASGAPGGVAPTSAPLSSGTAQTQTAAQSALKVLNSTGADVQKTAVNAFQSILKRTGSSKQN